MGIKIPIRYNQIKDTYKKEKMKTFALLAVAAMAEDKKVPPRHPLQRLNKLNKFAVEWCNDNLTEKQAANWSNKFNNNVDRFELRFERCGFYDDQLLPHGGPARKRRTTQGDDEDEEGFLIRYDQNNPVKGIKQITSGFRKWAERYLANDKDGKICKNQPDRQVSRANAWNEKLKGLLLANLQ